MPNREHARILMQGSQSWNAWRTTNPVERVDLSRIRLGKIDLAGADLRNAELARAELHAANLRGALLSGSDLRRADLSKADLTGADLARAKLYRADLSDANLDEADLRGADLCRATLCGCRLTRAKLQDVLLVGTDLSGADLTFANIARADFSRAQMVGTNLTSANIAGCRVYGVSVWNVCLTNAIQTNLIITPEGEATVEVDNLDVAQFVYLLLNNERLRAVIDTITSKVVLILGRFTPERKHVLDGLRQELRLLGYSPVLFDFDKPSNLDLTETITLLARLARFIIADITDPKSVRHELASIVPLLAVPVIPILEGELSEPPTAPYSMFKDLRKYHWVLRLHTYQAARNLLSQFSIQLFG